MTTSQQRKGLNDYGREIPDKILFALSNLGMFWGNQPIVSDLSLLRSQLLVGVLFVAHHPNRN